MMMSEKMVACLKANGKVLREIKDTVFIPFGAEYSILLKNLNTVRALVNIQIDGQDVCPNGLVIDAGREIDLERFVKNGNLSSGNRFKFIERTASVEKHRGVKAEDGLIRISFCFEKPRPTYNPFYTGALGQGHTWPGYYPSGVRGSGDLWNKSTDASGKWSDVVGSASSETYDSGKTKGVTKGVVRGATFGTTAVNCAAGVAQSSYSAPVNDVGITVPGSVSNQTFTTTTMGAMEEQEHVIVLRILGETEQGVVEAPITVKTKPTCTSCGRVNKATNKCCSECGTSLVLV